MFNYNHLYYFYMTAKLGGVSKASQYLHLSQPSLSIQIKTLEENLNTPLFVRTGRNLVLTDKGKVIYEHCERMFSEAQGLSHFLDEKKEIQESLTIGVSEQVERPFLADIVGNYLKKYSADNLPKIKMHTYDENTITSQLALGNIDLYISPRYLPSKEIEFEKFHTPVALIGSDKSLAKVKSLKSFFKNNDTDLIVPLESFILRTETDYFLSKHNFHYNIVFESSNMAANIRAISEGIGLGFFPIIYASKELKSSKLYSFMPSGGIWKHQLYLYYSTKNNRKESIRNFISTMEEMIQSIS